MPDSQDGLNRGLPLRDSNRGRDKDGPPPRRTILASHMIMMGYGHWFPNDIRGSGSTEVRKDEIAELGPIHLGRKTIQPTRDEIRAFFRKANSTLQHEPLWWRDVERKVIVDAFDACIRRCGYTIYAIAVLKNHLHFVIRTHRDRGVKVFDNVANAIKEALWERDFTPAYHPVFSDRPYSRFCYTPDDLQARIRYVEENPNKEGLEAQRYSFVKPYTK